MYGREPGWVPELVVKSRAGFLFSRWREQFFLAAASKIPTFQIVFPGRFLGLVDRKPT